jgi:hypothetical protein
MNPKEIWDSMDWFHLAQDRDKWCVLVNTVINLSMTKYKEFGYQETAFQRLCYMQLVIMSELCMIF